MKKISTEAAIDMARQQWMHLRRVADIPGPQRPHNLREKERARQRLLKAIRGGK